MGLGATGAFDLGLLIGMIEGEGEINICRKSSKGRNKNLFTLHPRISISNTDRELLKKIVTIIGVGIGHIYSDKRDTPCYRWDIGSRNDCLKLLKRISPFMVSKRKSKLAEIVIEFCESRDGNFKKHFHKCPYTEREKELYFNARCLNEKRKSHKGKLIREDVLCQG
jgi:hypothetical protein